MLFCGVVASGAVAGARLVVTPCKGRQGSRFLIARVKRSFDRLTLLQTRDRSEASAVMTSDAELEELLRAAEAAETAARATQPTAEDGLLECHLYTARYSRPENFSSVLSDK